MRAEVIAIGDELTSGQRLDTNSQWLSQRLTELGVPVAFHTTIGDELTDNIDAFRIAVDRADVVVVTGGLGPTADDLTRDSLAQATGTRLVRDAGSLEHIQRLFASRGREMPERNAVQADFPDGALPIPNPYGTAPGIDMTIERAGRPPCTFFALPGVPAEMQEMWSVTVAPRITQLHAEPTVIRHRRIKCFGVGESALEARVPDLFRRDRQPRVGITVSDATITLRITASGHDEADCLVKMQPTVDYIYKVLGDLVFGEEEDELEHVVMRLLNDTGLTLGVADLATEALLAIWLQAADKQGKTFMSCAPCLLDPQGEPCSVETAIQLAEQARELTGADIGLSVAAFPPAWDGPNAYVFVGLALPEETRKLRFSCAAHPAILRSRTAKQALNALRLALQ